METKQTTSSKVCCPQFDPAPWDGREFEWKDKPFIKGRVTSLFHIPLNFGSVIVRLMKQIEAAGAAETEMLSLSDETSPWGSDLYLAVSREIPGAQNVKLSGRFTAKTFDGDYRNMGAWISQMRQTVESQGKSVKKLYFFYTTCPKCAKKYGHNYVVIFAQTA